ncbi:hypothetical protein L6164_002061 [Bauhinia variegata]|uniref:Uncharacterized protein n=1 Tax=Bauhinia variegata TaxID=167791 RepID=A0ACB9PZ61_BAUVA|nr:hypothetical protein L6164_002061 [Bauhinia variegata]
MNIHSFLRNCCPCNGLYLLFNPEIILLLDPSMREYRLVPDNHFNHRHTHCPGFGFDTRTNDYKIIVIMDCTLPSSIVLRKYAYDTFVHGAFHWLACDDKEDYVIVAYDMADENFRIIRFGRPQLEGVIGGCHYQHVAVYEENIASLRRDEEHNQGGVHLFDIIHDALYD